MDTPKMESLHGAEAIKKIRELAEAARTGMLITKLDSLPLSIRPMATQKVDEEGRVYFMAVKDADSVKHISESPGVQLTYANSARSEYLALYGKAEVYRDQAEIDEMWSSFVKTWFPEGKDDPSLVIIRVIPGSGHYWDTQHGKAAQLLGMIVGAVTGKETDDSLEGEVRL